MGAFVIPGGQHPPYDFGSLYAPVSWRCVGTKKAARLREPLFFFLFFLLRKADSLIGTYVCTSATLGAKVRVDGIDVTFGDSLGGAFADTGTACDAVFTNYISHSLKSFYC